MHWMRKSAVRTVVGVGASVAGRCVGPLRHLANTAEAPQEAPQPIGTIRCTLHPLPSLASFSCAASSIHSLCCTTPCYVTLCPAPATPHTAAAPPPPGRSSSRGASSSPRPARAAPGSPEVLLGRDAEELGALAQRYGQPAFRGRQLQQGVLQGAKSVEDITTVGGAGAREWGLGSCRGHMVQQTRRTWRT